MSDLQSISGLLECHYNYVNTLQTASQYDFVMMKIAAARNAARPQQVTCQSRDIFDHVTILFTIFYFV